MRYLGYILLAIILYRFVTRFLIPVAKVTRQTSRKMREMQDAMQQMQQQPPKAEKPKPVEGTYIDYEEVK